MTVLRSAICVLILCASAAAAPPLPPPERFTPVTFPQFDFPDRQFNVADFGAVGDDHASDTDAINKAIAAANHVGGGTVYFPAGGYTVASVRLLSNVRLLLHDDATISGAKTGYLPIEDIDADRYQDAAHSFFHNAVLFGEEVENVTIEGGCINGGEAAYASVISGGGDKVISIRSGKNLTFKNLRHRNGAHFIYLLNDCEKVTIENVLVKETRDAINIINCRDVAISRCKFTGCNDDAIALKSDYALGKILFTGNVRVWNCHFESGTNGIQFGSETIGDIRNAWFWNITIGMASRAGLSITANDGGNIENVHFKDITMKKAASPVFMLVTNRLRTPNKNAQPGSIHNVTFHNITATEIEGRERNPSFATTLSGLPEFHIEDVRFENVRFTYKGNEPASEASAEPSYTKKGYQPRHLGKRPASAFYARHVEDLVLRDIHISYENENKKPPFVFFDADGVQIERLHVPKPRSVEPIRLHHVTNFRIANSPGFEDIHYAAIDMDRPRRWLTPVKVSTILAITLAAWMLIRKRNTQRIPARPEIAGLTD